jgi:hypothetical protein
MSGIVLERLLASADAALKREAFMTAITLYRRCILAAEDALQHGMSKLATTEQAEQAQFWRGVLEQYPHRVDVWFIAGEHSADPVAHYTAMLDAMPQHRDEIRLRRLSAACVEDAARHRQTIIEDFRYLWFRTAMQAQALKQISIYLHDHSALPVLELLGQMGDVPEPLAQFLQLRIEQIRLLQQLTSR